MRLVIVGAGVIGASIAWRAAEAGCAVAVVTAGGGAGLGSFAWLNAHDKQTRAYHDFTLRALDAHQGLRDELGDTPWLHGGGAVEWVAGEAAIAAQRDRVARLQSWGRRVAWIDRARLAALEPDIDADAVGDAPIAFYPDDGRVDPVLYAEAVLRRARQHGAVLHRAEVKDLVRQGDRVTGVALADGSRLDADRVVNCAGAAANRIAPPEAQLPLAYRPGLTVVTKPAVLAGRVIKAAQCYLRPDGAGRLMLHGKEADTALTPETRPTLDLPAAQALLQRAGTVIPALASVGLEAVRIVERPYPADGFPIVGPVAGIPGYYAAVMHSGVILAPLIGRLVVQDLAGGCADLAAFRADRFG